MQVVGAPIPCIIQGSAVLLFTWWQQHAHFWLKMMLLYFTLEGRKEGTEGKDVKENNLCCRYKNEYNISYMFKVCHYF